MEKKYFRAVFPIFLYIFDQIQTKKKCQICLIVCDALTNDLLIVLFILPFWHINKQLNIGISLNITKNYFTKFCGSKINSLNTITINKQNNKGKQKHSPKTKTK